MAVLRMRSQKCQKSALIALNSDILRKIGIVDHLFGKGFIPEVESDHFCTCALCNEVSPKLPEKKHATSCG